MDLELFLERSDVCQYLAHTVNPGEIRNMRALLQELKRKELRALLTEMELKAVKEDKWDQKCLLGIMRDVFEEGDELPAEQLPPMVEWI